VLDTFYSRMQKISYSGSGNIVGILVFLLVCVDYNAGTMKILS